ncbi:lactose PTS family porter repressor [Pediococcus damnosus]|uniref:DeoR/GlpR family DNA-binding transcription regulator n=1 Tax=Pediococcus damnosus TaxID=51663 RepID=UPI000713BF59|nr:lactose PTS family porter repressor [Pediococcus damnosus]
MIKLLKNERLSKVLDMINQRGSVTVHDLVDSLKVSSMTIRRDLDELADNDKIRRVHGGAQRLKEISTDELSYLQKRNVNVALKKEIAKKVASMIEPGETVFIGPGSTNEFIVNYLTLDHLRVVTNSIPIFQAFLATNKDYDLTLIGGTYRSRSGALVGALTNEFLARLNMSKAFVSVNGIMNDKLMNANPEEGQTQTAALDHSKQRFIVADHSKLNAPDFYDFYSLNQIDGLITDSKANKLVLDQYATFTTIY